VALKPDAVRASHKAAIDAGATSNKEPSLRPEWRAALERRGPWKNLNPLEVYAINCIEIKMIDVMVSDHRSKGEPVMRTVSTIARYLAGVIFFVFGLNGLLNFIPMPPPGGMGGQFMGALYASHYLWVIFAFQVIAGALLLVNRYVPLAVAVLAPVIVNIVSFHALMAPSGLPLALFVAVLWAVIFVDVRPAFAGLFQARLQATHDQPRMALGTSK
jgi:putative oxidoreductase